MGSYVQSLFKEVLSCSTSRAINVCTKLVCFIETMCSSVKSMHLILHARAFYNCPDFTAELRN